MCKANKSQLPQLNIPLQVNNSIEVSEDSFEQNIIKRDMPIIANGSQEVGLNPDFVNMDVEMQTSDGTNYNNTFNTDILDKYILGIEGNSEVSMRPNTYSGSDKGEQ